jgi:hypothetical protein
MSGFPIIDLVVGMIFLYFMLSIICSSFVEILLSFFKIRAKILTRWLKNIFNLPALDSDGRKQERVKLGQAIIDHCLTTVLSKKGNATTYIDAGNFVAAFLDKITLKENIAGQTRIPETLADMVAAIQASPVLSHELKRTITAYADEARDEYNNVTNAAIAKMKTDLELFRGKLEVWYDSNADRLIGRLKRRFAQPLTLIIATIMTVSMNADSVAIAKYLYGNNEARNKVAMQAYKDLDNGTLKRYLGELDSAQTTTAVSAAEVEQIKSEVQQVSTSPSNKAKMDAIVSKLEATSRDLASVSDSQSAAAIRNINAKARLIDTAYSTLTNSFPLEWRPGEWDRTWSKGNDRSRIAAKLAGLLCTILAIFMGAPFWFDLMNKVANLRGSGPKPASNTDLERSIIRTDKK